MATVPHSYPLRPALDSGNAAINPVKALFLLSKTGIVAAETIAGVAGMLLASNRVPSFEPVVLGSICIVLAASGAALANSVLDRTRDREMPRLLQRCQAIEGVGSNRAALCSALLMSLSLLVAAVYLNMTATLLIMAAIVSYLLLYTAWLKRRSPWGVFAGALPGALPPIIGSASVSGSLSAPSLLLAAIIFVWQLPHFWFLALKYRDEYRQAGIPVLPVVKGERVTKILILVCVVLLLPLTLSFWPLGLCSGAYASIALISWGGFLVVSSLDLFRVQHFGKGYSASVAYLLAIVSAIIVDRYL